RTVQANGRVLTGKMIAAQESDSCPLPRFAILAVGGEAMPLHDNRTEPKPAADPHLATVRTVCRHIEDNLEEPLTLAVLGERVGLSATHLQRIFKRITGITPRRYADACRLDRLNSRLMKKMTVTKAIHEAEYGPRCLL